MIKGDPHDKNTTFLKIVGFAKRGCFICCWL